MSIPRRTMFMPVWDIGRESTSSFKNLLIPIAASVPLALSTAADTLIWVGVILALAGPLMVSGLVEALPDYKILRSMSNEEFAELSGLYRLKLLVAVVCGNLQLINTSYEGTAGRTGDEETQPGQQNNHNTASTAHDTHPNPLIEIPKALYRQDEPNRRSQLMNLMSAQGDFGALVGAPIVFYLGGFVYTTLDLLEDPSDQDAAISLAFGVEWMIIVHVAIIAGCLLASNNPSAVSAMTGEGPISYRKTWMSLVYESRYQPVSTWRRGSNKEKWLRAVAEDGSDDHQSEMLNNVERDARIGLRSYFICVIIPTLVLISLPPAVGAVVAWKTPPVGWSCRSLSLVCYAACQLLLVVVQELRAWSKRNSYPWSKTDEDGFREQLIRSVASALDVLETMPLFPFLGLLPGCSHLDRSLKPFEIVDWLLALLSLFISLGGTIMQIMGAYKNCLCYVTAENWLNLAEAYVHVASDTMDQRHSSINWIVVGYVATGFMAVCAFIGWAYQKTIRTEYRRHVEQLKKQR